MFDQLVLPGEPSNGRHTPSSGVAASVVARPDRAGRSTVDRAAGDVLVEVAGAAAAVARRGAKLPLDGIDVEALTSALRGVQTAEGALAAFKSRLIVAHERARIADREGTPDTTSWLKDTLRLSGREANRQRKLAAGLSVLSDTAAALADGQVTQEHADQIARAARRGRLGDPADTETALLGPAAAHAPEKLRDEIKRREQAADADTLVDDENRAYVRRHLTIRRPDDDGMWKLHAELDSVSGEVVATALDALTRPDPRDTPRGERRSPGQRRADALVEMADIALTHGEPPRIGGVRPQVGVLVDADTVAGGTDPGQAMHAGPISPQASRRISCDSTLMRIVRAGRSMDLEVGRRTPVWNVSQRIAVVARDGHCRWPGCDRPANWSQIHHVRWWSRGGRTDVSNGALLCRLHHRCVHEGGWKLTMAPDTAVVTVTSPDGARVRTSRPQGPVARPPPRRTG